MFLFDYLQALSALGQNVGFFMKRTMSAALVAAKQKISWTRSVGELTFEGFHNPIQTFGSYFDSNAKDRFGYFYGVSYVYYLFKQHCF